jgi:hypothetical protein
LVSVVPVAAVLAVARSLVGRFAVDVSLVVVVSRAALVGAVAVAVEAA